MVIHGAHQYVHKMKVFTNILYLCVFVCMYIVINLNQLLLCDFQKVDDQELSSLIIHFWIHCTCFQEPHSSCEFFFSKKTDKIF